MSISGARSPPRRRGRPNRSEVTRPAVSLAPWLCPHRARVIGSCVEAATAFTATRSWCISSALAERAARQGLGVLLIGDLGQPRGGPPVSGHRSHQTGLDVDIWFQQLESQQNAGLGLAELEAHGPLSMLTSGGQSLNPRLWSDSRRALLKTVQAFAEVERVFVNPVIKRELCRRETHRAWLGKLRPWWGHDERTLGLPPGKSTVRSPAARPRR
jgi:penicillin-insensitive murein endopeptidase